MKNLICMLALVWIGTSASALECVIPKLDLDKVPFPIKSANTKFDLAEGETYVLTGTIVKKDGAYFFKVDFTTQPWLATPYRTQNPFLAIDPENIDLISKVGSGELVQMAVVIKKIVTEVSVFTYEKTDAISIIAPPIFIR